MAGRRALAQAPAYLVLNRRTHTVQVLGGPQVDYLLTEVYEDGMVTQAPGGAFAVVRPYEVEVGDAHEVVQYLPLHRDQRLLQHISAGALYRPRRSRDGRTHYEEPVMDGKALLKFMPSQKGTFYRTRDDHIVLVQPVTRNGQPRIVGIWKPLSAADFAKSA
ncbi:hypothetical protein ACH4S8_37860 [Streptomyces sp. NPDC021080]|uniref:hypothetical protein n=1 Tax=Streptomyces sp. NPDC021080 TaxID=3365110 RepID=UPI0037B496FA